MAIKLRFGLAQTPLTQEEIEALIPTHITTQGELDQWEAENIADAETHTLGSPAFDPLSNDNLRTLHKLMFNRTWKWAGEYRLRNTNFGVDQAQISVSIRNLCLDVRAQVKGKVAGLDEIAAKFHHRLVSIHPFPNGNGRHARLATDLLLELCGNERFRWGITIKDDRDRRVAYITALQAADRKNYEPILKFVRS
jgi:Fic-DOC domain mobile mystery protein B